MVEFNNAFSTFFDSVEIKIKENGLAKFKSTADEWTGSGENRKALFSRMYYILSGEAYLIVNGEKIIMTPGNLYFLPLGLDYTYGFDSFVEKLYFHINVAIPKLTHAYDVFYDCKEVITIPKNEMHEMTELYQSNELISFLKLKSILYTDIINVLEKMNIDHINIKPYSDTCLKALRYISENISAELKIKDIASKLFVSESKLNKLFVNETGTQIGKYINDMLFFEIEKQIIYSNLTDEEIARKFKFSDRMYLSRFFKKRTGYTTKQYRLSNRLNTKIIVD